jgi:X-Pro dipeptidyl-peptidase
MRIRQTLWTSASILTLLPTLAVFLATPGPSLAQEGGGAGPIFADGQAQVVPAFEDPGQWIHEELWVETELDTDGDGKLDRVHVAVVRQAQTNTEGLKVPVIYESSPYFAGTAGIDYGYFWDVRHPVGDEPPVRGEAPSVRARTNPRISRSQVNTWVPRGFAVVHSEAFGTGLSEGCPTVGGPPEALAPKAVIDWLNGRARAGPGASPRWKEARRSPPIGPRGRWG